MRVLLTTLIAGLAILGGHAQVVQTFTVSGITVDSTGAVVPGVSVELRQPTEVRTTVSDGKGAWRFEKVSPGNYEIRASLTGFRTATVPLTVTQAPGPVKIVLEVGALTETVTVTASAAVVSTQSATMGTTLGAQGSVRRRARTIDTASYAEIVENPFLAVAEHPLSTFSVDVDTASYANVRRFLNEGRLPPADAVRIEELINYFKFDYPAPAGDSPVAVTTELGVAPWNPKHRLALVGLRTAPIAEQKVASRNLTFLLDVSGSMEPENRLPLVKRAMKMLVETLRSEDRVGIVVYAGASGVALKPTGGDSKDTIRRAIDDLEAGGSTNGAAGIQLAYDMATENFVDGGINRVILATDGDFNVGITSESALVRLIEEKRERGIFLSVLGVGDDNLKDSTMEKLADRGNGNYNYLDSLQEARRVLIAEAGATLVTVAKDVKLQIEFNPKFVGAYRLIGYENRLLRKEDFNNDRRDAGEMGAGHAVTALYELAPPGAAVAGNVDPLKYQRQPAPEFLAVANSSELMTVKLRYKEPQGKTSRLREFPVRNEVKMSSNLGFASAVAAYGMLLRRSEFSGSASWAQVSALAKQHRGSDDDGYRAEFIRLAHLAAALDIKSTNSESLIAGRPRR